jgi:hypothetical protein
MRTCCRVAGRKPAPFIELQETAFRKNIRLAVISLRQHFIGSVRRRACRERYDGGRVLPHTLGDPVGGMTT